MEMQKENKHKKFKLHTQAIVMWNYVAASQTQADTLAESGVSGKHQVQKIQDTHRPGLVAPKTAVMVITSEKILRFVC